MKTQNIFGKILFIAALILFTILLTQVPIFGQVESTVTQTETVQVPSGDFAEYFVSIGGLATLTLLATQWFKKLLSTVFKLNVEGTIAGYASWVVALLLSGVGFWFQWGIFIGVTWYYILVYGVIAGLVANGIFKLEHVKTFFEVIKLLPKKKVVETKF